MGCKFGGDKKEEEKNELNNDDIDEENNKDQKEPPHNLDYYLKKFDDDEKEKINKMVAEAQDYSQKMLELFNEIRQRPNDYANYIEDSMDYIVETQNKNTTETNKVFKKHLKIKLNSGEPAFRNASKILKNIEPLPELKLKPELCVPLPSSAYDINDKNYLKNQIINIRRNRRVDAYFKENINIPELSALMLMVDDIGDNSGKRREIILRRDIQYVGISSGNIGGVFVAYFAFSR